MSSLVKNNRNPETCPEFLQYCQKIEIKETPDNQKFYKMLPTNWTELDTEKINDVIDKLYHDIDGCLFFYDQNDFIVSIQRNFLDLSDSIFLLGKILREKKKKSSLESQHEYRLSMVKKDKTVQEFARSIWNNGYSNYFDKTKLHQLIEKEELKNTPNQTFFYLNNLEKTGQHFFISIILKKLVNIFLQRP